jgi:carboxymethylenebutenolidase
MTTLPTSVERDGESIPLVAFGPADGTRVPSLVIVPSVFGIDDDLRDQMAELAETGALVVAVDPFFRTQPGPLAPDDLGPALERMQKTDLKASYADFLATIELVRNHAASDGSVAVLGICFGGPFCFLAAQHGVADAVITWHGSRLDQYLERAGDMKCPMKLQFGEVDPVVPLEAVERVRAAFANRADVEIVVHAGASHGFSARGSAAYLPAAERAAMQAASAALADLRARFR